MFEMGNNIFKKRVVSGVKYFYGTFFNRQKYFCISFQRTGTTSVGMFFEDHGFKVAKYGKSRKNKWTLSWIKGDYEKIFNSSDFRYFQVFEDDPWWCLDFYKVLFHKFPKSKFILLERDSDKWFDSMMSHSNGKTLGNTHTHSKIYRRELDNYKLNNNSKHIYNAEIDNLLPLTESDREHYKSIYNLRNREVIEFFDKFDEGRLFHYKLEYDDKWKKMGKFFNITVSESYECHVNKSRNK